MATFDQRNQKVTYQYNAAGNINFGLVHDKVDLTAELKKIQDELMKAVKQGAVNEEVAIDVDSKIKKAIIQTEKPEPNKKTILDHLQEAQALIGGVAAAAGLIKGLAEAAEVVRRLF
jgi:hypothetical protein